MERKKCCFVIIAYGKKTSYANGKMRVLDLDETYSVLIKPVFDELGIDCYRAIDKNLNGSIDKLMLQEIKEADFVLTDISTLNANVMWELGVRHALRQHHTIMICEKEQMASIPFDTNHFVTHAYAHSEEGIPYKEVERFRTHLKGVVTALMNQSAPQTDSPVFTFLEDVKGPKETYRGFESEVIGVSPTTDSFATIMRKADAAKTTEEMRDALVQLGIAKKFAAENMALRDNLVGVTSVQAIMTLNLKEPNELAACYQALAILEELGPESSMDATVLKVGGTINSNLYLLTNEFSYLKKSCILYEKAFQIKRDDHSGLMAVDTQYRMALVLKRMGQAWEDAKTKADYLRNTFVEILLIRESENDFKNSPDATQVLLSLATMFHYRGDLVKMEEYELKTINLSSVDEDILLRTQYEENKSLIDLIIETLKN